MDIDHGFYPDDPSYINYRVAVVDVLLSAKKYDLQFTLEEKETKHARKKVNFILTLIRYQECKKLIERFSKWMNSPSGALTYVYTLLLLDFVLTGIHRTPHTFKRH